MKYPKFFFTFLIMGVMIAALATVTDAYGQATGKDFVQKATIGSQFEISSSRWALEKSQDDNVRKFAQRMIDDHTQVASQLKNVISNSTVPIPMPNPSLDSEHQKSLDKLKDKSGDDFDRLYISEQVKAHDEAVKLFQDYAKNGDNDQLKEFAAKTLPVLQGHQRHIRQLSASYAEK